MYEITMYMILCIDKLRIKFIHIYDYEVYINTHITNQINIAAAKEQKQYEVADDVPPGQ